MKLSWKLKETKGWTYWSAGLYAVEGRDGKFQAYWGWVDNNIRAELTSDVFGNAERAKGFCEGHDFQRRKQNLLQVN